MSVGVSTITWWQFVLCPALIFQLHDLSSSIYHIWFLQTNHCLLQSKWIKTEITLMYHLLEIIRKSTVKITDNEFTVKIQWNSSIKYVFIGILTVIFIVKNYDYKTMNINHLYIKIHNSKNSYSTKIYHFSKNYKLAPFNKKIIID